MIRMGICDDDPASVAHIQEIVDEYFNDKEYGYSIKTFLDPMDLMVYLEKKESYDILILDVYMPMMLGTDVARELRNRGDQTRIIFLTTSTDHAIDAFAVRASDYLLKPAKREALFRVLDEVTLKLNERTSKLFSVRTTDGLINIRLHTILYVELLDRRLLIHTSDGQILLSRVIRERFEDSISDVYHDDRFVQCQKSFVVNMNYIKAMNSERVLLRNGTNVPISKKFYQNAKKKYMEFLLREEL